jgi:16S rRNA pseudouridine516 synthase
MLQSRTPRYVLLHKPAGYVSATTDPEYPTVISLIHEPWAEDLHLAGRLDRATTGLVILTNDSTFSEALTEPGARVPKAYVVTTDHPVSAEAVMAFEQGMFFAKEGVTTQPAFVEPFGPCRTRLTIYEGKHHQVKRMFARFDICVTALHRESVGKYHLDNLPEGSYCSFDAR